MTKSDRPNEPPDTDAERPRAETGLPVSGRSATVAEIGRELGDLDFEPDDLLASLHPMEPAEQHVEPLRSAHEQAKLAAPKIPTFNAGELAASIRPSAPIPAPLVEAFESDEPVTHALPFPAEHSLPMENEPEAAELPPSEPSTTETARPKLPPMPSTTSSESAHVESKSAETLAPEIEADLPSKPGQGRGIGTSGAVAPSVRGPNRTRPHPPIHQRPPVPRPPRSPNALDSPRVSRPIGPPPLSTVPRPNQVRDGFARDPGGLGTHEPGSEPTSNSEPDASPNDIDTPFLTTSEDGALLEELVALPPERNTALSFQLERPASAHLQDQDLVDGFHDIAVVLTREAQAPRHPQEQAELALLTSEMLAILGQTDMAREYLGALAPISTPAGAFQARQLAFVAQDLSGYAQLLRGEIRSSVSNESRRHVMALYADTLRLVAQEDVDSRRHLEMSARAFPSDARFWLQRLAAQFNERSSTTTLRPISIAESPTLTDAARDLSALRSGAPKRGDCSHPAGAMMAARRAWQKRTLIPLLDAISDLRTHEDVAAAAMWLQACLTAMNPAVRSNGNDCLDALIERGDEEAELAQLERRLHDQTERPTSVEVFSHGAISKYSAVDRLALALAVAADADTLRLLCNATLECTPNDALARAAQRVHKLTEPTDGLDDAQQARLVLGDCIGALRQEHGSNAAPSEGKSDASQSEARRHLASVARELHRLAPHEAFPRVLRFDDCLSEGTPLELAANLAELGPELSESELPLLLVLASLLAQIANAPATQADHLKLALAHQAKLEVAYRGQMAAAPEPSPAALLALLVEQLEPSPRRSMLELERRQADEAAIPSGEPPSPPAKHEQLGPMDSLLDALGAAPKLRFSDAPDLESSTDEARWFAWLLDTLREPFSSTVARPPPIPNTRLVRNDPQLYEICSTLQCPLPPMDDAATGMDAELRSWLRMKQAALGFPFSIDRVEPAWLTEIAQYHGGPALSEWQRLYAAQRGGDAGLFTEQVNVAMAEETLPLAVDRLQEASLLDPDSVPLLGSLQIARNTLERNAKHLLSLRIVLRHEACHGQLHRAGPTAAQIARQLDDYQRLAHAWFAITSTTYRDDEDASFELAIHLDTLLESDETPPLWASRKLLNLAQVRRDDQRLLDQINRLRELSTRAIDAATLTLRAAEAASRLEQWEVVGQLLDRAVDLHPEHLVALSMRAEYLEARGDTEAAAGAYDALAQTACMPAHKVAAWVQAATLWGELGETPDASERALMALEHAVELDPSHAEANFRLRQLYIARGNIEKLEDLLTRLLLRADSGNERAQLEFARAQALLDLGRTDEAQSGLARTLSLIPEHEQALVLSARLHEERGDFEDAEQHWIRLASLNTDESLQLEAYQRLAMLYETSLEQPARAEVAYREVLRRRPNDPAAERLVQLLLRLENRKGAVELLEQLVADASDPSTERTWSLELARVFDEVINDRRRAEEVLDRARRKWPNDASTVRALSAFYRRGKDLAAHNALLDRSLTEARRALGSGRFDTAFFEIIAVVAELRDATDFSDVAQATLAALKGQNSDLDGIAARAADDRFADILAPEVLSLPLRAMLRKSGSALCAANPIDLRALGAVPLAQSQPELSEQLRGLAHTFGLFEIDLYLSPALGAVCQPTSSAPVTLVIGEGFVALRDESVKLALVLRAMRILSANAAALANTAPVELWPLLVGYLSCYLPEWLPPGVDAAKVRTIRERILKVLPTPVDPDAPPLAAEIAASIGNRASQLGMAVQQWGSRTALLAIGNPTTVLFAIAAALGQQDRLEGDHADRQKWILRNAEARDLAVFSVSDHYLTARAKGLE